MLVWPQEQDIKMLAIQYLANRPIANAMQMQNNLTKRISANPSKLVHKAL